MRVRRRWNGWPGFSSGFGTILSAKDSSRAALLELDPGNGRREPCLPRKTARELENLIKAVTIVLKQASERGELANGLEPEATARFIISAWQGALLRMKAAAGPEPLDNFQTMVFQVLLA